MRRRLGEEIEKDRFDFKLRDERVWSWTEWRTVVESLELNAYRTARAARNAEERNIPRYDPLRRGERATPPVSAGPQRPQPPTWKSLFEDRSLLLHEGQVRRFISPKANGACRSLSADGELAGESIETPEKGQGGAKPKWDWDRAKADAYVHFRANGFAPSDSPEPEAVKQIASWLADWINKRPGTDGASVRPSDPNTKKVAREVYEMWRREEDDRPARL